MAKKSDFTNKELLIRIDERQQAMYKRVATIEDCLTKKVETKDFSEYCEKVEKLWDERNRLVGLILGAGTAGGLASKGLELIYRALFNG